MKERDQQPGRQSEIPPETQTGRDSLGRRSAFVQRFKRKAFYWLYVCATSLALCAAALLVGEILCRNFSEIPLGGNSRNLFAANAFGESKGNAKNATAVSFGVTVYTDDNGFRAPPPGTATPTPSEPRSEAVLILGDSVAFGAGVEEPETLAGRLRTEHPELAILNSSVIGYRTSDYLNVIDYFPLPENLVTRVYLVFCLNDVSPESAASIDQSLADAGDKHRKSENFVESMKKVSLFARFNEFLRPRSKLYLLAKNNLTNSKKRYQLQTLGLYSPSRESDLREAFLPIVEISLKLDHLGIAFMVIIPPFDFQVDTKDSKDLAPQRWLTSALAEEGIDFIDARGAFAGQQAPSEDFFLPYDTMHLSALGHRIIAEIISQDLSTSSQ